MAEGAEGVAAVLIGRLERAWNEADGRAFGEPFAPDADPGPTGGAPLAGAGGAAGPPCAPDAGAVASRGEHLRGRGGIAAGHQAIFDSIYEGSSTDFGPTGARELSSGAILAHATDGLTQPPAHTGCA